jgi:hypothetical protein
MKRIGTVVAALALATTASQAQQVLNFEGINAAYPSTNYASINGF